MPMDTDITSVRPYAIMINNHRYATPQDGIAKADILFEALAEGSITRFLAVFTDVTAAEDIGPIRSSRPYYLDMTRAYDAIYVHAGGSDDAYIAMKSAKMTRVDGVNGGYEQGQLFYRDSVRRQKGLEHSLMLMPDKLVDYVKEHDYRTEHYADFEYNMKFADESAPSNTSAESIEITFRGTKTTSFQYDPETKLYTASQFGSVMTDALDDSIVSFRNVLTLFARVTVYDSYGRLKTELSGKSGRGFFFSEGKFIMINWSKADADAPFVFTDESGAEIVFGRGKTYIGIVPTDGKVVYD